MPVLYPHYSHSRYRAKRRWKKLDLILDSGPRDQSVQSEEPLGDGLLLSSTSNIYNYLYQLTGLIYFVTPRYSLNRK